jgi:hypothetical protein
MKEVERLGRAYSMYRDKRNTFTFSVGKLEGTPRFRWENNIKMDRKEIVWEDVDWIFLALERDKFRASVNKTGSLQV